MTEVLDMAARRRAVTEIGSSFLVEAGAGSGKTSILAARVIFMLASGVAPKSIAAITFTEAAASELFGRVSKGIEKAVKWDASEPIGKELQTAFPDGVSEEQKAFLKEAQKAIGSLTITTIHGFCQRLIKPFPVEADIDPGASIVAGQDAELLFSDVLEQWLRGELSREEMKNSLIACMIAHDPAKALSTIKSVAQALRDPADITVEDISFDASALKAFLEAAETFLKWNDAISGANDVEGHVDIIEALRDCAKSCQEIDFRQPAQSIMTVIDMKLSSSLYKADGQPKQYRCKSKWQKKFAKAEADS